MKNILVLMVIASALITGSAAVVTGAVGEPEGIVVEAPSVLAVEHPKNSATGVIHVRNPGKSAARIMLRANDFVSAAGKPLNATVVFSNPGASAAGPVYAATVEPGALHTVKVDVANVWEAGESSAKILDGEREVAVLRAMKYRVPLAVRVVGTGDDPVILTLEKGRPGQFTLRNEDPMTYNVEWRLTIEAESVTGKATLPPNWTTSSPVTVNPRWFSAPLEGFFKDELKHGTLALRLTPPSTMADPGVPERIIPVRARLVYWPSPLRHPIIMAIVFGALLAGGLCSLMLNQWLPNRLRRVDLEERLGDIATRARNVSFGIDSDLRIQVRVERFRLLRLLGSRYAFSPEMSAVLSACAQAADHLQTKVSLLERIDAVGGDVRRLSLVAPPTLLRAVEDLLQKAEDRLRRGQPTDADLQAAGAIMTEAEAKLTALEQPDADFLKALIERFQERQETFDPTRTPGNDKLAELRLKHPALFAHLQEDAPDPSLRADAYFAHDLKLLRLELLQEYLELRDSQCEETEAERSFLSHVGTATAEAYAQARLDLRAIREGIFPNQIESEIQNKQIHIEAQPADPRPHQAVELSAVFTKHAYNRCGARHEYECLWTFNHVDSDGRRGTWLEKGWHVNHFFPKPGKYTVRVSFRKKDGQGSTDETKPIEVVREVPVGGNNTSRFGDRTWIEAARFGVVLFATVLGLLGGAREQLMKLDVLAGLIAVFLIGFGADTVKNMLTQQGGAPEPTRK